MRSELCIEKAKRPLHRRSGLYHLIPAGLLPELIEAFIILKAGCPHLAHNLPDICIVIFTELFKRRVSVSKHHIQKTEKYIRIFRQTIIHITLFSSSGPDPVLSGGPVPARKTPDARMHRTVIRHDIPAGIVPADPGPSLRAEIMYNKIHMEVPSLCKMTQMKLCSYNVAAAKSNHCKLLRFIADYYDLLQI